MSILSDNLSYIPSLENLASQFRKLPGIGKKSAYRLAYALLELPEKEVEDFAGAMISAKKSITKCSICQNISDSDICPICADSKRNARQICVVEDPRDVAAIVKINEYSGVFHVLGGLISPLEGKTPDKLTIKELLARINSLYSKKDASGKDDEIEVILATNPSVEGDATAMYISRLVKPLGVKVTRLAYGIPVGGDLEYADDVTLSRALSGRNEM